jgi:hypothetical protein
MPLFNTPTKILPDEFARTDMTPCPCRGKFPAYFYFIEMVVSVYLILGTNNGFMIGVFTLPHSLYRLYNARKYQASCPHCQTLHQRLSEDGRTFTCKSCQHRLGIYGLRLADLDSGLSKTTVPTTDQVAHIARRQIDKEKSSKAVSGVISLMIFIGIIYWWFGGGLDKQAHKDLQKIQSDVAESFKQQYFIAERNGSKTDMCVQAGIVVAAYLQAKDETNYAHWKKTQTDDCRRAGLSGL